MLRSFSNRGRSSVTPRMTALALPLLLSVAPLACKQEAPGEKPTSQPGRAEIQMDIASTVSGTNQFAIELYRSLRDRPGNLFCSPHSVAVALAMTSAGARGATEEEMEGVLHLAGDPQQVHAANQAIRESLIQGSKQGGYELRIANRLWGGDEGEFLPAFLQLTRERYGAELERVGFRHAPEKARETINLWVAEQTEEKIKDLMPPGSIDVQTRLVLTNAIYFKGLWESRFDPQGTSDLPFFVSPEVRIEVPTMQQAASFPHASIDGVQILELPYKGKNLSMIVLLPEEIEGLPGLEERLTQETLATWIGSLREGQLDVALPRFTMTSEFSLAEVLARMGMPGAFDPDRADFSGMNGARDLYISAVAHKAFVEVNEEGTEAAAATGVVARTTSMGPSFTANHPFLFLIRDRVTGVVLFLGRVANPAA